ncbi:MAG TPA: hypothetical protein GX700_15785 [Paracoccus sp.]|nr:hypothetical protein [Paracoccus sp. (in: a-proteobacteria)]
MPRLRAEVLRVADIRQLPDSQFPRPQLLAALDGLHSEDAPEPAAPTFVSTGPRKRFVVVTRRCTSSDDPRLNDKIIWLEERQRQEPGMQILFLHTENGTLKQIRLDQVLHILRSLAKRRDAARPSDPDGTGRQLEGLPAVDSSPEPESSEDDYGPGF